MKDENDGSISKLRQKGADTVNESSRKRGHNDVVVRVGQRVHNLCRSYWTNPRTIKRDVSLSQGTFPLVERKSAPVSLGPYNSKMDCLFCGQSVVQGIHVHDEPTSDIKISSLPETMLALCEKRADDWAVAVKDRIQSLGSDLLAVAFEYHVKCIINFRVGRGDIPGEFREDPASKPKTGSQCRNEDRQPTFLRMCQYFKDDDFKLLTISDLFIRMRGYLLRMVLMVNSLLFR